MRLLLKGHYVDIELKRNSRTLSIESVPCTTDRLAIQKHYCGSISFIHISQREHYKAVVVRSAFPQPFLLQNSQALCKDHLCLKKIRNEQPVHEYDSK